MTGVAAKAIAPMSAPAHGAPALRDPRIVGAIGVLSGLAREDADTTLDKMRLLSIVGRGAKTVQPEPIQGLRFENLAKIAEGGIEPPAALVPGMILEGCVNWFAGHPGHGKTTVVMNAAMQVMRDHGRHVIWLDWEGGKHSTLRRLLAVGVSLDHLRERFGYVVSPRMSADAAGFEPLRWELERRPGALVVFDSASKALSTAGLDENSPSDATRWTTEIVMPIREAGGTAIVIDHMTKGANRSTGYARGAGSKLADTEVMWFVEAEERFNKSTPGKLRLSLHKDREGVLPVEGLRFEIGDGAGGLPLVPIEGDPEAADAGVDKERELRRSIVDLLRRHDGQELTTNQVTQEVEGSRARVSAALKSLAAEASEPVASRAGSNNAVYWRFEPAAASALDV